MSLHLLDIERPRRSRLQRAIPFCLALFALALITAGLFANVNKGEDLRHAQELAKAANTSGQWHCTAERREAADASGSA